MHIFVDKNRKFNYGNAFTLDATQSDVYEKTAGGAICANIVKGFNVTILAYDQIYSGNTCTVGTKEGQGYSDENDENDPNASNVQQEKASQKSACPADGDGIIPCGVYNLFNTASNLKGGKETVKMEMSYLEIYNSEARDFLCTGTAESDLLQICNSRDGVIVQHLSSVEVHSPKDVGDIMQFVSYRHATASSAMNDVSS
eukprot:15360914-Ditylum_brightwellii.AAC.1